VAVLAVCGGDPEVGAAVVAGVLLLGLAAIVVLIVRSAKGERLGVLALYLATALIGALFALVPDGLSGGDDTNYLGRFVIGTLVGLALGGVLALLRDRRPVAYVLAGLAGGATFMPVVLLLLLFALATTDLCLD
jgi:hypothetical protein